MGDGEEIRDGSSNSSKDGTAVHLGLGDEGRVAAGTNRPRINRTTPVRKQVTMAVWTGRSLGHSASVSRIQSHESAVLPKAKVALYDAARKKELRKNTLNRMRPSAIASSSGISSLVVDLPHTDLQPSVGRERDHRAPKLYRSVRTTPQAIASPRNRIKPLWQTVGCARLKTRETERRSWLEMDERDKTLGAGWRPQETDTGRNGLSRGWQPASD